MVAHRMFDCPPVSVAILAQAALAQVQFHHCGLPSIFSLGVARAHGAGGRWPRWPMEMFVLTPAAADGRASAGGVAAALRCACGLGSIDLAGFVRLGVIRARWRDMVSL